MVLFSLALLISLYLRWKPAYYIFVASGALKLFGAAMAVVLSFNPPSEGGILSMIGSNLYCAGLNVFMAGMNLWLVFQMQDDFAYNEIRILFRPDSKAVGSSMLLARGHEYAKRKMWALAALHLRRGVGMMPGQMDGRGSLILTYLKLKKYDMAAQTLEDARRINPDDPRLDELQTLLDGMRADDKSN